MPPAWLTTLSWVSLGVAFASALVILDDVYRRGYRQPMTIMEVVWPVTALYLGPLGLIGYRRFGRPQSPRRQTGRGRSGRRPGEAPPKPAWVGIAVGVSHCGAGCTLGDVIAEFSTFAAGATLAGEALYAQMIGDYVAALALGILFQYFAIAPMQHLRAGRGLVQAAKADVLSLTAFEVGLFSWMTVMTFVLYPAPHHLRPDSAVYWFLMQIGMAIGFVTAWPANVWLIRRGIKEAM